MTTQHPLIGFTKDLMTLADGLDQAVAADFVGRVWDAGRQNGAHQGFQNAQQLAAQDRAERQNQLRQLTQRLSELHVSDPRIDAIIEQLRTT